MVTNSLRVSADADLITAYLSVLTAAAAGLWAVHKYLAERRAAREQQAALSQQQLEQRRDEQVRARQERAATLIRAVGEAADPLARRWTMSALSLYPEEALDLLLAALGEADQQDAAAIKLAVISMGPAALSRTVHAQRIASQICSAGEVTPESGDPTPDQRQIDMAGASRIRDGTREIILHLLLLLDDDQRAGADLAKVDLTGVSLSLANLKRVQFRKARLDRAVMARGNLRGGNFRGASLDDTVLTRANLRSADLTGACGPVRAIRANLSEAILDHADLSHSTMDAVQLNDASLRSTNLDHASLPGAKFTGAVLDKTRMVRVQAHHLSATRLTGRGLYLFRADLTNARLPGCRFEKTRLAGATGEGIKAPRGVFIDCDLRGTRLPRARLDNAEFHRCDLAGTILTSATLQGAVFYSCTIASADLSHAVLTGARFESCTFKGTVSLLGVDLTGVAFDRCTFHNGVKLDIDHHSWRHADLDDCARAAFDPVS
ncbi:MAG: pentapeptide repeat-containing protein [Carbonactinosporaceae bacterium]